MVLSLNWTYYNLWYLPHFISKNTIKCAKNIIPVFIFEDFYPALQTQKSWCLLKKIVYLRLSKETLVSLINGKNKIQFGHIDTYVINTNMRSTEKCCVLN